MMPNTPHTPRPDTDDRVALAGNDRGTEGHHTGQEYDASTASAPRYVAVAGEHGGTPVDSTAPNRAPGEQIPAEAGRRGYVDERTGEVHGSGSGAGGGNPAEDYDTDTTGDGGAVPATQVPSRDR